MRDTHAIAHSSAALQRLLDPMHPDPLGEAKHQLKRLTADELQELMTQLLVLVRLAQEVERLDATEIDRSVSHKVPNVNDLDRYGRPIVRQLTQTKPKRRKR